ncbi:MAG: 50S ribosomal protein L29 [Bacteroidetes bacterium]|nr:MAG: 50S ribosomal protein L29 [Bacteroidota bacterium]
MKNTEIIQLTTDELLDKIAEEKANYAKLKMNHAISPLENPLILRQKRKYIARLLTELNKRKKQQA